ncbi:polyketide synthase dehydratase domain-containing protein [Streptomyces sp. San01]
MPWLADHRVAETPDLPGTGFAEILLTAAAEVFGTDRIALTDLRLETPLVLDPEPEVTTRLVHEGGQTRAEVLTRTDDGIVIHARATVRALPDDQPRPALDPAMLPSPEWTDSDPADLHRHFRDRHNVHHAPPSPRSTASSCSPTTTAPPPWYTSPTPPASPPGPWPCTPPWPVAGCPTACRHTGSRRRTAHTHILLVLDPHDGTADKPAPARAAVHNTLTILQQLAKRAPAPRLWTLWRGEHALTAAGVRGLLRAAAFEHPELRSSSLEVSGNTPLEALLADLLAEDPSITEVAWRDGRRSVARVRPGPAPRPTTPSSGMRAPVRPGGSYLVTGGLGGLGLVTALLIARARPPGTRA